MRGCFATCTRCLVVCWCCLRCFAILFCDAFSATCTLCTLASLWCFLHIVCSFKIACYGQRGWTLFDQQTDPTLYFVWNKGCDRSRKWLFSLVKRSWNVNFLHRAKTSWEVNFFCAENVEPQTVFGTQERKSSPSTDVLRRFQISGISQMSIFFLLFVCYNILLWDLKYSGKRLSRVWD